VRGGAAVRGAAGRMGLRGAVVRCGAEVQLADCQGEFDSFGAGSDRERGAAGLQRAQPAG
jgi:hypothetical protein